MWQYKKVLEREEAKDCTKRAVAAINLAAVGCALAIAAFALEALMPQQPELMLSISVSKIIACFVFVTWGRAALQEVGAVLQPLDRTSQPKPQNNGFWSRLPSSNWRALRNLVMIIAAPMAIGLVAHVFFTFLHSDICPHKPLPRPEQCDRFSSVLSHLDAHTRGMYYILKQTNYSAGDHQTAQSMTAVTAWRAQKLRKYNLFQEVDIPVVEEAAIFAFDNIVNAFTGWLRWLKVKVLLQLLSEWVSPSFFPADDIFMLWPSPQEGVEALKFAGGQALERIALNTATSAAAVNVTSDEAIQYLATAGLAAHHLRACTERCDRNAAFLVDYTLFSRAPVRNGYEGYGAIAYFDGAMKVTHINCSHCGGANVSMLVAPGDELWEHAKWVFKVSMLVTCTIKDHLVGVHLMCVPLQQRVASLSLTSSAGTPTTCQSRFKKSCPSPIPCAPSSSYTRTVQPQSTVLQSSRCVWSMACCIVPLRSRGTALKPPSRYRST